MRNALITHDPSGLSEDASLATALTSSPITGRDAVVSALLCLRGPVRRDRPRPSPHRGGARRGPVHDDR
jgi:hypothetical protein